MLTARGGYGGGYTSSDVHIWHKMREEDEGVEKESKCQQSCVSLQGQ